MTHISQCLLHNAMLVLVS